MGQEIRYQVAPKNVNKLVFFISHNFQQCDAQFSIANVNLYLSPFKTTI